ncbi:YlbE family protein [Caldinitratiruptor microaerophilus]|uniref:DUF1116 domain-containing protein n=1 Tax=Caldinitratiruptor microaerophilus TaxID=671077 RepID=A0AA35G877_9FIRM|nr:DUF1116 domain-containing protein [Caldinitratiruptor microaerophilus]BDG60786.1 hypothetical protein caldi_18760 [Caldinitratiruptor microaerophilus]
MSLLRQPLHVLNVGTAHFADSLRAQGIAVTQLDWQPPAGGDPRLVAALEKLSHPRVEAANARALEIILSGHPVWVDVATAGEVIPGMTRTTILHSGPPNRWETMAGPQRGAVMGALMLEGLARTPEEAAELAASGAITFRSNNDVGAVGPMAGVTSYSSAVFVVENKAYGNRAFANLNEGYGRVLRMGAYAPDVLDKLRWINTDVAETLRHAVREMGGLDLRSLIAQALHMGDECHNRNKAAGSLFLREVAPYAVRGPLGPDRVARVLDFIGHNEVWFVNLSMAAAKATLDAARGVRDSTVVTCMSRNGYEFGLQVSGLPGRWFTGPAQKVRGLYFPGFTEADASPDIGDSVITETAGIGGFAMAAAPAIVQFVGGTVDLAIELTRKMYEITLAENRYYQIPYFNFRGTPTGIDVRRVVETGILPSINTGIAHKDPGVGQVGAGLVNPPANIFADALLALADAFDG